MIFMSFLIRVCLPGDPAQSQLNKDLVLPSVHRVLNDSSTHRSCVSFNWLKSAQLIGTQRVENQAILIMRFLPQACAYLRNVSNDSECLWFPSDVSMRASDDDFIPMRRATSD
jgi:hypothetical protein